LVAAGEARIAFVNDVMAKLPFPVDADVVDAEVLILYKVKPRADLACGRPNRDAAGP
jgi:hypothetical protein